jgi:small subunit ribosomal protein S16
VKLIPGLGKKLPVANVDPKRMKHVEAIILSMTPDERRRPEILNGSRRARIARGSGRSVAEVNRAPQAVQGHAEDDEADAEHAGVHAPLTRTLAAATEPPGEPETRITENQMAVKIRLRRMGRKKAPHYRIVVADSTAPRDGRFVESLGYYKPLESPARLVVDLERVDYWVGQGARPPTP